MGDVWFKALMAVPPVICGRQLLPFSVAHSYILASLGNPYADDGPGTREALMSAIEVCSHTWEQNRERLIREPPIAEWLWWSWRWRRMDFKTADASFRQYVRDFTACPGHWSSSADSDTIKSPWQYHVVRALMDSCGMRESESWNCPVGRAKCYYDAIGEANGDKSLVSQDEENQLEAEGLTHAAS